MPSAQLKFRILGPAEVVVDGERLTIAGARQRALLTALLSNANRVVSRDRLIEQLVNGATTDGGHALNVQISRLRSALAADPACAVRLVTQPPGYLFRVEPGELDLDVFEQLVADGRRSREEGDVAQSAATLREAESLWRGPALADLELEPFARGEINRLEELRQLAIDERIDAELALGRHTVLVSELEARVAEHPLRETARGQLMLALYRSGRQADALAAYREARRHLVGEFGLEPSPQLRELEQAILRQDETLRLPRPTGAGTDSESAPDGHVRAGQGARRRRTGATAIAACAIVVVAVAMLAGGGHDGAVAITHGDGLVLVSPQTGRRVASVALRSAPTRLIAATGSLWVTQLDAGTVTRIDPRSRTVSQTIRVGSGPTGIAAARGALWVANSLDATVSRIDPANDSVVQTIAVGGQPTGVAALGGSVWVASHLQGTVSRIDAATGRVTAVVRTGRGPTDVLAAAGALWVSNEDAGTVTRIDPRRAAVVASIDVGDDPIGLAADRGGVWVLDRVDVTVTRIDPARNAVTKTIALATTPSSLAVIDRDLWISGESSGSVQRIDARTGQRGATTVVGERGSVVGTLGGGLWAGVTTGGREHRGGTLVVSPQAEIRSLDPAILDTLSPLSLLGLTNDGLVTLDHAAGPSGARLVPDLAVSLPVPTASRRTYSFRLRPGIRYSTGASVVAADARRSIERLFELESSGRSLFSAIVGAQACVPHRRCDLARGIVTDDRRRTVTFRLRTPDPDLLFKLAEPYAYLLPRRTPGHDTRAPLPATGPYRITVSNSRELRLTRNPRFREWSTAAQPDGYPDHIVLRLRLPPERAATLVERGQLDLMTNFGPPPRGHGELLETRFSSRLRTNPTVGVDFFFLNTNVKPFDDIRVRQALNYAFDRRRAVAVYGGTRRAQPTCQIVPPQLLGYKRYCPYTEGRRPGGRWRGPNLRRARQLIAASGTAGTTVKVWDSPAPRVALEQGRYLTALLRRLGYRASLHLLPDAAFYRYTDNSRNHAQVISGGWSADYPSASNFLGKLSCDSFIPNSPSTIDNSGFCDPAVDRRIARAEALQLTDPARAQALWSTLDHDLTDAAALLPTVTPVVTDILGTRVGNYHYHPFWGALVDQLWVR